MSTRDYGERAGSIQRALDPPGLQATGVVAILRSSSSALVLPVAEALVAGGIACLELTLTMPDALTALPEVINELGADVSVGVGTVLSRQDAVDAISAGAQFLVSPSVGEQVASVANSHGLPFYPGAFTPTEILTAWELGATAVKVFPASVGGPGYLSNLKGPLPGIRLAPTGGVLLNDAGDYIRSGADFVGVGSPLIQDALADGDLTELSKRASQLVRTVADARASQ